MQQGEDKMYILIVDDEPLVRNSMARMVGALNENYRISQAEDGEDASELLDKKIFDLVITDIRMPAMDGLKLAEHIHDTYPQTYVVMLTGYSDFDYARKAIQFKVMDYLLKPASVEDIQSVIEKIEGLVHERKTIHEVGKLRDLNLLEKRVQDLLYELPVPYYDESLFPEFSSLSILTFSMGVDIMRKKTIRFSVKNIIGDICSPHGTPIVVVEESHITTVLFSKQTATMDMEKLTTEIKETIKKILKQEIRIGIGGMGKELSEVSKLYQASLEKLGMDEPIKQESGTKDSVHRLIRSALSYIEQEYASDLTLTLIAERLFVNPNYLSSLFRTQTGSTFTHHLTKIRMEKAKELLCNSNQKIYEICSQVGYLDQAHFSRVFKTLENVSPYEFREREQKK